MAEAAAIAAAGAVFTPPEAPAPQDAGSATLAGALPSDEGSLSALVAMLEGEALKSGPAAETARAGLDAAKMAIIGVMQQKMAEAMQPVVAAPAAEAPSTEITTATAPAPETGAIAAAAAVADAPQSAAASAVAGATGCVDTQSGHFQSLVTNHAHHGHKVR